MSNYNYRSGGLGGFSVLPPVIKGLLIANVAAFFLTYASKGMTVDGVTLYRYIMEYFSLMPLGFGFMPWQLITYQFLHGSFSHILFNMFALWMFGMEIESQWGSKRFLGFYMISGIGGGILQLLLPLFMDAHQLAPTIGASGAIFGVMIAFGMLFPDRLIYIYFFIPVRAKYMIGFMVIFNLLAVSDGNGGNVAYLCHIGGALSGFIYMLIDSGIYFNLKTVIFSKKKTNPFDYSSNPKNKYYYSNPNKQDEPVQEAEFFDINSGNRVNAEIPTQEEVDRALDKVRVGGYKNLTEREKKILFQASQNNGKGS